MCNIKYLNQISQALNTIFVLLVRVNIQKLDFNFLKQMSIVSRTFPNDKNVVFVGGKDKRQKLLENIYGERSSIKKISILN